MLKYFFIYPLNLRRKVVQRVQWSSSHQKKRNKKKKTLAEAHHSTSFVLLDKSCPSPQHVNRIHFIVAAPNPSKDAGFHCFLQALLYESHHMLVFKYLQPPSKDLDIPFAWLTRLVVVETDDLVRNDERFYIKQLV